MNIIYNNFNHVTYMDLRVEDYIFYNPSLFVIIHNYGNIVTIHPGHTFTITGYTI